MLEIDILFNLPIKDCMLITSTTRIFKGCSTTKFDSNWTYSRGLRKPYYRCWLVIHIISLHWLFIQIETQWISLPLCKIHQLSHVVLCFNNFLSCQLHIFFNRQFLNFQDSKRIWDLPICLLLLSSSISHVHYILWQNRHSNVQVKSWNPPLVSYALGIHLYPNLRAPHNSLPYIRHYFPQVMVSSTRIELKNNPFQKLLLIPNFE
jgi:hypothetical protein